MIGETANDPPTRLPSEATTVTISNFARLKIAKSALSRSSRLKYFKAENIDKLELESYALGQAPHDSVKTYIDIVNCSIDTLPPKALTGIHLFRFHFS